ncbi:MAG: 50S ribosome-binding GTPase [Planctomycetes bacterium]|nr:50S ribosome-binding GTPase [Planctomycetota bacterium]
MPGGDPGARLLTPRGRGGVAIVDLSGPARWDLAARLLGRDAIAGLRVGTPPRLLGLHLAGGIADRALVVVRPASIELHVTGSPALVAEMERALGGFAPDPALAPAERLLREAIGTAQLALALEQRGLDFAAHLEWLRSLPPPRRQVEAAATRERSVAALALAWPVRLVLCGARNAGKSTLFNRLAGGERVLAGPTPGLTRDPVAEPVELGGYPYLLVDTAGEGEPADALEAEAIVRARELGRAALRILVVDGCVGPGPHDAELRATATLVVRNKVDLPQAPWPPELGEPLPLSCADPAQAFALRARIGMELRLRRGLRAAGPAGGPAALDPAQWAALAALA